MYLYNGHLMDISDIIWTYIGHKSWHSLGEVGDNLVCSDQEGRNR